MDTCVRGFSFMPETTVKVEDLQFIEGKELERTWKQSRRQRLKSQEEKVWEEFVKEQDVVKVVCKDDPYQFLHQLPESCLKELMEEELQKALKEDEQEQQIEPNQGSGDTAREEPPAEREECDMFHIFDDERDASGPSGPEDECLHDSMSSPCTVRERDSEIDSPQRLQEKEDDKSPENVSNVIESSIHCAKVKDLRLKIHDEILSIIASLDRQDVMTVERDEVSRMCRRSAEFTTRFNRVYMYQLQRQMQDVKRHTMHAAPFAIHTHFHAQMARVASLHQNLLQAMQIFHKSMEQTACVRSSAALLHALALLARELSALAAGVRAPPALRAHALYQDEMLASCDKLDEAVCEHSLRVADFLSTTDNTSRSPSRKFKGKAKKKMRPLLSKPTKSVLDTDARLSMYSLDTLRVNLNAKSSKDNQSSGTSKMRGALSSTGSKANNNKKEKKSPKSPKRSPRHRRPLMRAGTSPGPRRARLPRDTEISTMVEAVETCTSSHMSREASPAATPRARRRAAAPRATPHATADSTPRKSTMTTPRQKLRNLSPKAKIRRSPKQSQILKALSSIQSDPRSVENHVVTEQLTPVSKVQCAKKETTKRTTIKVDKILDKVGRNLQKDNQKVDKIDKAQARPNKVDNERNEKGNDFDSARDINSVGIESQCDSNFDGFRDFESSKESHNCGSSKEASSCKEKEVTGRVVESPRSSREERDGSRSDRERNRSTSMAPARCEVTKLIKQLCSGDATGSRCERVSGPKNAQLHCVSGGSPRQPSTPQLLRILEETIQKKAPKPMYPKSSKDPDRLRMVFNFPRGTAESLYQYRTRFVQHMLASSMYANSAVGKPWEMICSVSDKIIDELLLGCAKEMQVQDVVQELYKCETQ